MYKVTGSPEVVNPLPQETPENSLDISKTEKIWAFFKDNALPEKEDKKIHFFDNQRSIPPDSIQSSEDLASLPIPSSSSIESLSSDLIPNQDLPAFFDDDEFEIEEIFSSSRNKT